MTSGDEGEFDPVQSRLSITVSPKSRDWRPETRDANWVESKRRIKMVRPPTNELAMNVFKQNK